MTNPSTAYYNKIAGKYPFISVSEIAGKVVENRHKTLVSARKRARSFVLEKKDGKWTRV